MVLCSGCTAILHDGTSTSESCARACTAPRSLVIVANGAGGFNVAAAAMRETVAADGLPLQIETFDWTHGHWRVVADQVDRNHALVEGSKLAARIVALHQSSPDLAISLVGHSAGCAVVLAAVEALPPGSIDRIVFLAPAVSADHDLRPALACARRGVDVFYSRSDLLYLGVVIGILGNADHSGTSAAGRVGFQPDLANPGDEALYAKLRQYPWDPCLEWTGNMGGHYGAYQPGYLRAAVLPLLLPDDNAAPTR
jgi:pimeloyl-ACP methyl ester carboxylesterase